MDVIECRLMMDSAQDKTMTEQLENVGYVLENLIHLGLYHLDKKQYKKACEYYRQAFLMQPNDESLLETLDDLERVLSPMFFPMRLFWYVHPGIVWIGSIAALMLLRSAGLIEIAVVFALVYVSYALYSWIVNPLYKFIHRK